MRILAVNFGSMSLKAGLFEVDETAAMTTGRAFVKGTGDASDLLARALSQLAGWQDAVAVGHRAVHGGSLRGPALIDEGVMDAIRDAGRLAPLHNGPSLDGIGAARAKLPGLPMVAVFDTAFHATLPEVASRYALPDGLARSEGILRYGFHGLAHRSMLLRYTEMAGVPLDEARIVTLQLGGGCSAAAIREGRSVDTSMGLTPLEGLVMSTRAGDVDPGALLYLQRETGMSPDEVDDLLNRRSGLLGMTGTADVSELLRREANGDRHAGAALQLYCYRAAKYVAAYHIAVGGMRGLVFGGGVGQRFPAVRQRICRWLSPLGLVLDPDRNAAVADEGCISAESGAIEVYVVAVDEETLIAADTFELLHGAT